MPLISVIIPARDDAKALRTTLDCLEHLDGLDKAETLVAAAGAKEQTEQVVGRRAKLLWPGVETRSGLMNAGATEARGDVLFFLHADSFPPRAALKAIDQVLQDRRVVGGAFAHRFDEAIWSLRVISWINRTRYFLTHNYYGDQGIFVRSETFHLLGGYRNVFMEDLDFSRRLKKLGRTRIIPLPVITSGRRFLTWGPWRAFSFILWVLLLHSFRLNTQRYASRWESCGGRMRKSLKPFTRS